MTKRIIVEITKEFEVDDDSELLTMTKDELQNEFDDNHNDYFYEIENVDVWIEGTSTKVKEGVE